MDGGGSNVSFLENLHSIIRWLILIAGALAILRAGWGYLGPLAFGKVDNALGAAFTGLLDLNALVGIVLLIMVWNQPSRPTLLHPALMILSVALAHASRRAGAQRPDRGRHLFQGGGFLICFVLIGIGIRLVA
jgi:hypothetical protein